MNDMKYSKLFITGCDKNTRWMLPWFLENFKKHNDTPIEVFNFDDTGTEGWFNKPNAMLAAADMADKVIWLDTDCEVRADLSPMFDKIQKNKLSMVLDRPWTKRRPERGNWYNSGVVGYTGKPPVLTEWHRYITQGLTNEVGDQEVLHWMLGGDPLREMVHINELPHIYNTLRLDLIDNTAPKKPHIMHWTGSVGKLKIKDMMDNG
jgi:hypothetical protein